jgi:DNA-binding NtrC family response regulator
MAMAAKILVVDDSAVIRRIVVATLRLAGHEVAEATSGNEALARLLMEAFDVALSDLSMPGGGGLDLLDALQRTTVGTEVVLLTGTDVGEVERSLAERHLPPCELVVKAPANQSQVLGAIDRALERKARRVQAAAPPARSAGEAEAPRLVQA